MIAIPYGKSHLDVAFPYNGLLTSRVDELKSDRTGRELVEEAMASPMGTPTLAEKIAFMACWTISSGITFQASRAVALALCAPSICAMPAHAISFLDSQASTKERAMFIFL